MMQKSTADVQVERQLDFLNLPELWIVGLVILPLTIAFAWWCYGGLDRLEPKRRVALSVLRGLAIGLCLLALSQPVLELIQYSKVQTQVHVLIDDSASMQRRDTYPDRGQRDSLAKAASIEDPSQWQRSQLVQRVLERQGGLLEKLKENHDLRLFRFVRQPLPIRSLAELSAKGNRTPLGDALDLHLSGLGAANVESVILVSDGRSNAGLPPQDVAVRYRGADLPIYAIGVGDPLPPKNARIVGPGGPKEALRQENVLFDVEIYAEGLEATSATVSLEASLEGGPYITVASEAATLGKDGEAVAVRLRTAFGRAGDYTLRFRINELQDETTVEDNTDTRFLRVNDEKIRILFIDDYPRWEYRYMQEALKRVDASVEMQAYLFDASPDFPQERSEHLPPLLDIPRSKADFMKYHVVLIGDVPPERLGATEEQRNRWLSLLVEFVEFGGGVGMVYGERSMPERYRGTPLEDLLPVILEDRLAAGSDGREFLEEFRPELDNPTRPHEIALLKQDARGNADLWQRELAPLVAFYPVQQAKAGADAILRHPTERNRFGKRVLCATGFFPRGRTFFLATDESWRWRKDFGEVYHDSFWRNVVRHLASGRLRRRDDRVDLRLDRLLAETGQPIRITLEKRDEEMTPTTATEATFFLRQAQAAPERKTLQMVPGEPGVYRGSFSFDQPTTVSVLVLEGDRADGKVLAREDVRIQLPDRERSFSTQDRTTLEAIAAASKDGRYYFLGDADRLLEQVGNRRSLEQEIHRQSTPLWDRAWVLFTLIGLLAAEWILRKRSRLV